MPGILTIAACLSLGLSLGALGGMLGIGGGLIAIPLLAKLYGMDQQLAQGTALIMIVPNVLVGFYRYHQRHQMKMASLAKVVLPSIGAAWLSSQWAVAADANVLRMLFAGFLVAVSALLMYGGTARQVDGVAAPAILPMSLTPLIGIASGFMSGFFTVGGGLVVVPALVLLFGVAQVEAQGIALATVVPSALVALMSYSNAGHVSWSIGLPMAVGGVLTVSAGVALAHKLPTRFLKAAFTAVLLATALGQR